MIYFFLVETCVKYDYIIKYYACFDRFFLYLKCIVCIYRIKNKEKFLRYDQK